MEKYQAALPCSLRHACLKYNQTCKGQSHKVTTAGKPGTTILTVQAQEAAARQAQPHPPSRSLVVPRDLLRRTSRGQQRPQHSEHSLVHGTTC
ncbi:hypothetical protein I79_002436 [Cricetulus griseus]|uniref:Uncharacterized protein n=1 Tax=Cricetulus griseus TaxID=10029 RepID=G3GXE6_CRIGR|nr:hypothetical protein I79_002436 [Cricetulus griseus]